MPNSVVTTLGKQPLKLKVNQRTVSLSYIVILVQVSAERFVAVEFFICFLRHLLD